MDEGKACGGVFCAELVEKRGAVAVVGYVEERDVGVCLGGEVAGDA